MAVNPGEWMRQADYALETAEAMLAANRNIYAVFMCHLAIEKALKGYFINGKKNSLLKTITCCTSSKN